MKWKKFILSLVIPLALAGSLAQAYEPGDILLFDTGEYQIIAKNKAMDNYFKNVARLFIIMKVRNEYFTEETVTPEILANLIQDENRWDRVVEQLDKLCAKPPAFFRNSCADLAQERLDVFSSNRGRGRQN